MLTEIKFEANSTTRYTVDENHPSYITAYVFFALLHMDLREPPAIQYIFEADSYTCEEITKFINEQRSYNHLPLVEAGMVQQILNHSHDLNLVQADRLYKPIGETRYHFIKKRGTRLSAIKELEAKIANSQSHES